MNLIETSGTIIFDPIPEKGNIKKLFKPYWVIVVTNDDVDGYYRWFLNKRFNLILQAPAWGPHLTIVAGNQVDDGLWDIVKKEYNNTTINFTHENLPKSNGTYWWLKSYCPEIENIRKKLKLPVGLRFPLHLTLGVPIPRHQEHSTYIHRIEITNNNYNAQFQETLRNSHNH